MFHRCVGLSVLCVISSSCGDVVETQSPAPVSPLESTFQEAAAAYQVPVETLKAIAYVESRVEQPSGPSLTQSYGVMQLSARSDWNMLAKASSLTGYSIEELKTSPRANIWGAAAVLRDLHDASLRQYPELKPHVVGDLFHAVSLYPGIESAALAQDYAVEVFSLMERGFEVETQDGQVQLESVVSSWRKHAPYAAREDGLAQYPQAYQWKRSPNFRSGRSSYDYIIIHTTQGAYNGAISWFQNTQSKASSHYVVKSSDGQVTQMVEHEDTAWHAGCFNPKSIGIEHEGFVENPQRWYTDAMYEESARLTRWIADRHQIPKDRTHIIGHVEVDPACNRNRHHDPGAGWNWTKYMGLVQGTEPTVGTGKLTGVVYQSSDSRNRVAGATVTCNGMTQVTKSDGSYTFILPPGTYTVEVSKDGHRSKTTQGLVKVAETTWASVELFSANEGKWVGIVYEFDFLKPTDSSKPLAGARVEIAGQTITTSATGYFEVVLPEGRYTAQASAPNYYAQTAMRTVPSNDKVWGSIGLLPVTSTQARPISIEITEPRPDSEHDIAIQTLRGSVTDSRGEIQQVEVRVNGGQRMVVPVSAGAFEVPVKLAPGENAFEVVAVSQLGPQASAKTVVNFQSGVAGRVYDNQNIGQALSDASVELLDADSGETEAMVRTNAQGRFQLSPPRVPATYRLLVKKNGYITSSETISVPDDQRLKLELPLTYGTLPEADDMAIEWAEPLNDSLVSTETVKVTGSVVGMQPVSVSINGLPAELLGAGGFSVEVPLSVGENTLSAVAFGADGEKVVAELKVRREAPAATPWTSSGCTHASGLWAWAFVALIPVLRRRGA